MLNHLDFSILEEFVGIMIARLVVVRVINLIVIAPICCATNRV